MYVNNLEFFNIFKRLNLVKFSVYQNTSLVLLTNMIQYDVDHPVFEYDVDHHVFEYDVDHPVFEYDVDHPVFEYDVDNPVFECLYHQELMEIIACIRIDNLLI